LYDSTISFLGKGRLGGLARIVAASGLCGLRTLEPRPEWTVSGSVLASRIRYIVPIFTVSGLALHGFLSCNRPFQPCRDI